MCQISYLQPIIHKLEFRYLSKSATQMENVTAQRITNDSAPFPEAGIYKSDVIGNKWLCTQMDDKL